MAEHHSRGSTSQLIEALAANLQPATPMTLGARLALAGLAGAVISAGVLSPLLGRPVDVEQSVIARALATKLLFGGATAAFALWSSERLARPGVDDRGRRVWLAIPMAVLLTAAVADLTTAPMEARSALIMGHTPGACMAWIVLAAGPPLTTLILLMRTQAPTRPALTGSMLGVAAGGLGACAYALHCGETSNAFIAAWYAMGIALAAGLGAAAGARLLRW